MLYCQLFNSLFTFLYKSDLYGQENASRKNLELMEKLTKFLLSHPEIDDTLPKDASLVILSADDTALNEVNDKLIPGLLEEGKHVVKAQEIKSDTNKWEFSPVAA